MLFLAPFNLQGGFTWIIHEDLHNYICYFSWHELSEARHSLFIAASCMQLNGQKTYCPHQAQLKKVPAMGKHTGKAVAFLCPARCCCWNHVRHQRLPTLFSPGHKPLLFSPVVWEMNGNFLDSPWAYFGKEKVQFVTSAKLTPHITCFIYLTKQF